MSSGLSPKLNAYSAIAPSQNCKVFTSLFKTIPPERVGLNGEYDHNGLAKRVALAFNQEFKLEDIVNLKIRQRGGVVILMGKVSSQRLLARMITAALRVSGATDVETYGVSVELSRDPNKLDYRTSHLHAC
ncbi:hypothetical protein H6G89_04245 [Oscillatoria sp. FACHB-1407]|uniref:BON domain-containing protein n=1 Tax=Oscillatoria sp. FACHB-1407 TaxID=2692847 RepID=UPI00168551A1|nr:hypothetical protein [Oscillatoria sp. FACHB-1407]MBD2460247.1 hypothetical protein [Oscillatoria sp. FACHB-1407]